MWPKVTVNLYENKCVPIFQELKQGFGVVGSKELNVFFSYVCVFVFHWSSLGNSKLTG